MVTKNDGIGERKFCFFVFTITGLALFISTSTVQIQECAVPRKKPVHERNLSDSEWL